MATRIALFGLIVGMMAALGCEPPRPSPSDPAVALKTLTESLDAWKRGDSHEAYKQSAPAVTVVDRHWQAGGRLKDFEIHGEPVLDGFDVQYKARLEVVDASGKSSKQKAVYNVSTRPALVIVRAMD